MYTYLDKCAVRNVEIFTEAGISNWRSWYESQLRLRTDSVALRVATHFPPFQWPFPFRCVLAIQNCLATRKYKPSQKRFHLHDFLVVHHRGAVAAIRAVSFTKGFMWAGVIKALLDLHCLFRVIWREYNRCFSRWQSATTFRNWTWKSRSKWIQQVACRIP